MIIQWTIMIPMNFYFFSTEFELLEANEERTLLPRIKVTLPSNPRNFSVVNIFN